MRRLPGCPRVPGNATLPVSRKFLRAKAGLEGTVAVVPQRNRPDPEKRNHSHTTNVLFKFEVLMLLS